MVNARMATQTEGRRLALLRKSLPSVISLVGWLFPYFFIHIPLKKQYTSRGITSSDTSRRKKQCLTVRPRCLVDWAFHHSAEHAASSSQPATAPVSATIIHRGPPASLSRASRRYILACSQPDASSLDSSPALRRSQHCWVVRNSRHKTKHGILATALGDSTI